MIFKTFDSDIDKISAKWGVFGKSFYDFAEASRNRKIAIDDLFTLGGVPLKDAKKQAGSFWSYLYPKKEDIQAQMIDVDSMIPKLDSNNFDFNKWINELNEVDKKVKAGKISWQDYSNELKDNQKWIAKWGQETQGTIRTQEGLVKANENARQSALAHNEALKQQTLGAKAATVATKALSMAANMLVSWGISLVIEALISLYNIEDKLAEKTNELKESLESTNSELSSMEQELSSTKKELENNTKRYEELIEKQKESALTVKESNELQNLIDINTELADQQAILERNIELKKESAEITAQELLNQLQWQENVSNFFDNDFVEFMKQANEWLSSFGNIFNLFANIGKFFDLPEDHWLNKILHLTTGQSFMSFALGADINKESSDEIIKNYENAQKEIEAIRKKYDRDSDGMIDSNSNMSDEDIEKFNKYKKDLSDYSTELQKQYKDIDATIKEIENDPELEITNKEELDNLKEMRDVISDILGYNVQKNEDLNSALNFTKDKFSEEKYEQQIKDDTVQSVFGNVETDKRTIINWSDELKETYQKELSTWDYKSKVDPIDTIFDDSGNFDVDNVKKVESNFDWESWFKDNSIDSQEEIDRWIDIANSIDDASEARDAYLNPKKDISDNISFFDLLNSSDLKETKEKLLDLAKSGELTSETLSSTEEYNKLLEETKTSAESAKNEILDMLSAQDKLSAASQGLDKLKSAYEEFKNEDIGFVTAETLSSLPDVFKNLPQFDLFSQIVGDPTSGVESIQQAFNDIVKSYLISQDTLSGLVNASDHEVQSYIANLKQMGISNSKELVNQTIATLKEENRLINDAENEFENAYKKYLESKNEADLDFLENSASNNGQLIQSLGSAYKSDYDNWCELLKKKATSYNDFVKALNGSYDESLGVVGSMVKNKANMSTNSIIASLTAQAEYEKAVREANKIKDTLKLDFSPIQTNFNTSFSPSSSKTSSSSSKSSESEKEFDHIATKLEKLSDELSDLDGKVANTYSTWTERNKKLTESINKTKEAISLQNQAYQAYMREANAVGLSDTYKRLVQNGAMNISVIKDDKLADKISKYEDYYNKAQDAFKSATELQNTLNELSSAEKWELFKGESDADISELDAYLDKAQNLIDKAELQGKFSNSSVYTDMLSLTTNKITDLRSQAEQLSSILGTMTQGTEAYDELFNELLSIRNQISDLENECIEFNNNIRNLNWEVFEYLEDSISRITDEMHYLIDLVANEDLFDDKGSYTKYADATIALHAANYDVYKQMAQDYYEEVQSLQKELLNGGGKDVLEQYNEMLDKHRDMIKSANDEKQAILDLVENGMSARLDALNEIIDKYNELEDKQQSARDYQKDIENQVKSISALEKQLMAYQNDDSEEAKSKIQQITVDLEDARQQLEETEMDKNIQDRRELLESLSLEFQEWQNARIDNSDELLNQIIGNLQTEGDEINATLKEVADANGTLISGSITSIFDANSPFTSGLTSISDGVAGTTNAINNLIAQVSGIAGILTSTNAGTNDTNKGSSNSSKPVTNNTVKPQPSTTTTVSNTNKQQTTPKVESKPSGSDIFIHKKDSYPKNKLKIENSVVDRLKKFDFDSSFQARATYYSKLGGSGAYKGSASQNVWMIKKMKEMGYKKGSSNIPYDQMNWVHDGEVILKRVSDGGYLTELTAGSKVLNSKQVENLWNLSNMKPITPNIELPKMPVMQSRQEPSNSIGDVQVNIELPNVQSYEDFMTKAQNDTRFEGMIQHIAFSKNPMDKYKYKWK